MYAPIIPKYKGVNREQKRAIRSEIKRNLKHFDEIERMFLKQLFENNDFTYQMLYDHYHKQWKDLIKHMNRNNNFVHTILISIIFTLGLNQLSGISPYKSINQLNL